MSEKQSKELQQTTIPEHQTRRLDSGEVDFDSHAQYLDRLYHQYNIQVDHALLFYVENNPEPVIFVDKTEINIGRRDERGRIAPEFDVSGYKGAELGVSRLHAKIVRINNQYLIQDLHSTNHTWLNGQKLLPYQYSPIRDGSILQFGRLAMNAFIINR